MQDKLKSPNNAPPKLNERGWGTFTCNAQFSCCVNQSAQVNSKGRALILADDLRMQAPLHLSCTHL